MLHFFLLNLPVFSCFRRPFIDFPGEPKNISESGCRTYKKQDNYPKRSPTPFIYFDSNKRAQEYGNKHIDAELTNHHQRMIDVTIKFQCLPLLFTLYAD